MERSNILHAIDAEFSLLDELNSQDIEKEDDQHHLKIKLYVYHALLAIILDNPELYKKELSKNRISILHKIYVAMSIMYKELYKLSSSNSIRDLLMLSIVSFLTENQINLMFVKKELKENIPGDIHSVQQVDHLQRLEFETYRFMILLLMNSNDLVELTRLNHELAEVKETLIKAQNEELMKDALKIKNGLRITAFGNMSYLMSACMEFLLTGKRSEKENQNMLSCIDRYSHHISCLIGQDDIELEKINILMNVALKQIVYCFLSS